MVVRNDAGAAAGPLSSGIAGSDGGRGEALDAFRDDLMAAARREIGPDLAAKVSASDIVQDTFLAAGRDIEQFRGAGPAELRGWLKGILKHLIINTRRRYRGTGKRRVGLEIAAGRGDGERAGEWWATISASATSPSGCAMRQERELRCIGCSWACPSTTGRSSSGTIRNGCRSRRSPGGSACRRRPRGKVWGRALLRLREALGPGHDPR